MKRRVVKHGPSTYIVSLPSSWVKKYNIKKGDELELNVEDDRICIYGGKAEVKLKSIILDVSGKIDLIEKIIGAVFRAGYDEVTLTYSSNDEHEMIHKVVGNNVIGFEIINEQMNKVQIKSVTSIDINEFNPMFRRGFLFLLSMAEDSHLFLKEKKYDDLFSIVLRDNNINRISDFCRRSLNKYGHKEYSLTTTVYSIAIAMERLGDFYKDLSDYCGKEQINASKEILDLFKQVNQLVRDIYESFYNFDLDRIQLIMNSKKKILKKIDDLIIKCEKSEIKILNLLRNISSYASDLTGVIMVNFL